MISVTVESEDAKKIVANGGQPLVDLCRKEVSNFDAYLRSYGSEYKDGLSRFERAAIEGYLYQKLRGRLHG
jgi:hypothetical protein